jgi:hypothetical protein
VQGSGVRTREHRGKCIQLLGRKLLVKHKIQKDPPTVDTVGRRIGAVCDGLQDVSGRDEKAVRPRAERPVRTERNIVASLDRLDDGEIGERFYVDVAVNAAHSHSAPVIIADVCVLNAHLDHLNRIVQ